MRDHRLLERLAYNSDAQHILRTGGLNARQVRALSALGVDLDIPYRIGLDFLTHAVTDLWFEAGRYTIGGNLVALSSIPGYSFTRAGTYYAPRADGSNVLVAANVPGVTDIGFHAYGARTNYAFSPTAAPTTLAEAGLVCAGPGLVYTLEGYGTDAATGLPYVDVRCAGTTTATYGNFSFLPVSGAAPASQGDVFTSSAWLQRVAGTFPTSGIIRLGIFSRDSEGGYLGAGQTPQIESEIPTDHLVRFSAPITATHPSVASVDSAVSLIVDGVGTAVDFTLRIAGPQFEPGPFATPYIPTSYNAAAAVGADVLTFSDLAALGIEDGCTIYVEADTRNWVDIANYTRMYDVSPAVGTRPRVFVSNSIFTPGNIPVTVDDADGAQFVHPFSTVPVGDLTRLALRVETDSVAAQINEQTLVTDSDVDLDAGQWSTLTVGNRLLGDRPHQGSIARFTVFAPGMTDEQISALARGVYP